MKKFFAEVIGTFMLVFIGTGSVVFGNGTEGLGHLGIALAFGLSIVAAAYSIGTVSGAHLNPAVSIAMFVNKRLSSKDLVNYIVAQVVGAVLASATVFFLLSNSGMSTASLGENALAKGVTPLGGFLFEVIASFIFILVIMTVTCRWCGPSTTLDLYSCSNCRRNSRSTRCKKSLRYRRVKKLVPEGPIFLL